MINFVDSTHVYTNNGGREYISVTTFIALFKNKFNAEEEALKCEQRGKYIKGYKYAGMTKDEILLLWDEIRETSLVKGSAYHDRKELEVLYSDQVLTKPINGKFKLFQGYQQHVDLNNLEFGITYPELRVYLDKYLIAGHVDLVPISKDGVVNIEDYKTNAKPLSKESYKGKKMLFPLDDLPDCDYYHYALQLNIYAWILEQWGYTIGTLKIRHKRFDDNAPIPEKYMLEGLSEEELREEKVYVMKYRPDIITKLMDERLKECKH